MPDSTRPAISNGKGKECNGDSTTELARLRALLLEKVPARFPRPHDASPDARLQETEIDDYKQLLLEAGEKFQQQECEIATLKRTKNHGS